MFSSKEEKAFEAIEKKDAKKFAQLLREGLDIETRDNWGRSFMQRAIGMKAEDIISSLSDHSFPITREDFFFVVQMSDLKIIDFLLTINPDLLRMKDRNGDTAIEKAVTGFHPDVLAWLLEKDPELVKIKNNRGQTPLFSAVFNGRLSSLAMLLERYPDLLQDRDIEGDTLLHAAVDTNQPDLKIVSLLLGKGIDPGIKNNKQETALDILVKSKRAKNIADLLRSKAGSVVPEAAPDDEWKKLSEERVAHVVVDRGIGYQITDIFNFRARDRIRIVRNIKTKAENAETRDFDSFTDTAPLQEAFDALVQRGGKPDPDSLPGRLAGKPAVSLPR